MLRVEFFSESGHITLKNITCVAYGNNCSRLIYENHGPILSTISTGKVCLLHLYEQKHLIRYFYHTEAVLEAKGDAINMYSGRITEVRADTKFKVQDKLYTDLFKQFISKRENDFDEQVWIDLNQNLFKFT